MDYGPFLSNFHTLKVPSNWFAEFSCHWADRFHGIKLLLKFPCRPLDPAGELAVLPQPPPQVEHVAGRGKGREKRKGKKKGGRRTGGKIGMGRERNRKTASGPLRLGPSSQNPVWATDLEYTQAFLGSVLYISGLHSGQRICPLGWFTTGWNDSASAVGSLLPSQRYLEGQ